MFLTFSFNFRLSSVFVILCFIEMVVLIFIVHFIVISALQLLSVSSQGGFTQVGYALIIGSVKKDVIKSVLHLVSVTKMRVKMGTLPYGIQSHYTAHGKNNKSYVMHI